MVEETTHRTLNVLVIDDEPPMRRILVESLAESESINALAEIGYAIGEVRQAVDPQDALNQLRDYRPDILISDTQMGKYTGYEYCEQYRCISPNTKIIGMSGNTEADFASRWQENGASYMQKPDEFFDLLSAVPAKIKEVLTTGTSGTRK